jgi:hypothetical protein
MMWLTSQEFSYDDAGTLKRPCNHSLESCESLADRTGCEEIAASTASPVTELR